MAERARYIATASIGIEPELAADLASLGAHAIAPDIGRCFFEGDIETAYRALHGARVADKIHRVLAEGDVESLRDVVALARGVDWPRVFPVDRSFAVRGTRVGDGHDFTSMDAAAHVGEAVIERYLADTRTRPKVRLNGPEVEVRVLVRDEKAVIAVNLAGASLHRRGWRVVSHMAPMKPTLASALVRFASWQTLAFPPLFDPTTGSGTIPIEAALAARRIPPGRFRLARNRETDGQPGDKRRSRADPQSGNAEGRRRAGLPIDPENSEAAWFHATHEPTGYLFHHLKEYGIDTWESARERMDAEADAARVVHIQGTDFSAHAVDGAIRNAGSAGVLDTVGFSHADVKRVVPEPSPRVIVANPPFGARIGSPAVVDRVNRALADLVERTTKRGPVTAAFVTGDARLASVIDHEPAERRRVLYGTLPVHFLRYELS